MTSIPSPPRRVVVIGGGPAARRLADAIQNRDDADGVLMTVLAEEPRLPYDRVALSRRLDGDEELTLQPTSLWDSERVTLRTGDTAGARGRRWSAGPSLSLA